MEAARRIGCIGRWGREGRSHRRRGIGHFAAVALSAAAAVGFFMIVYPVAKTMMTQTAASMQTVNQTVLNATLCGATDLSACSTSTSCTNAGGTWDSTTNTCS